MATSRHVFITSDWHLGGTPDSANNPGTQICRSTAQLADFIRWVRNQADVLANPQVELIVNGDLVDFLAPDQEYDPQIWMGDESAACARLRTIVQASRAPFDAMAELLQHPRCSLTIILGNHDVELSLPAVRRCLREEVLRSDGRGLEFFFDGEACTRGRLLVEHGNRYDPLNAIDFSRLRQERSHLSRGLHIKEAERNEFFFQPPYGTQLVVNAFNQLLEACPFLNLLKPEGSAALPLVLALHPTWLPLLREAYRLFKIPAVQMAHRPRSPAQPNEAGYLAPSSPSRTAYKSFDDFLRAALGSAAANEFLDAQPPEMYGLLGGGGSFGQAYDSLRRRMIDAANATVEGICHLLDAGHTWGDDHRRRLVRQALRRVKNEDVFSIDKESDAYLEAARQMAMEGKFQAVVFGHTHFAKKIQVGGGAYYFNSGTWADVIRLPDTMANDTAESEVALDKFLGAMAERRLEPYLRRRLTFVEAKIDGDGNVQAQLMMWNSTSRLPQPYDQEAAL